MPVTRKKTSADWIEILNERRRAVRADLLASTRSFADPQVQHLADGAAGAVAGRWAISPSSATRSRTATSACPIRTPAPELGQDNEEILTSLGYTKDQIADLAKRGII